MFSVHINLRFLVWDKNENRLVVMKELFSTCVWPLYKRSLSLENKFLCWKDKKKKMIWYKWFIFLMPELVYTTMLWKESKKTQNDISVFQFLYPTYNYEVTLFLKWSDPTCLFSCLLFEKMPSDRRTSSLKKNDDRKKSFWRMGYESCA